MAAFRERRVMFEEKCFGCEIKKERSSSNV